MKRKRGIGKRNCLTNQQFSCRNYLSICRGHHINTMLCLELETDEVTSQLCIIPVRMNSSRFPGKPLTKINNREMLSYVYENCVESNIFDNVVVATPDNEIKSYCQLNSFNYVMTSHLHERASDRCEEVVKRFESQNIFYDVITLVQGDEPLVDSSTIKKITEGFTEARNIAACANGFGDIKESDLSNPNCIKVILDNNSNALYMSRNSIPYKPLLNVNVGKQVCVIPFTSESLKLYSSLTQTSLEVSESVDMLRFIQNNYRVKMIPVQGLFHPVDVPSDVAIVEEYLNQKSR